MDVRQQTSRQFLVSNWSLTDHIAEIGLVLAILAGITAILSGLGTQWGWWYFRTGIKLLRVGAISGAIAAVVSLGGVGSVVVRHERRATNVFAATAGILIGLLTVGIPWSWAHEAERLPSIHDITTDMINPPQFRAIIPLRVDAVNSAVYGGQEIASQQMRAYPDIRPLSLSVSPITAFNKALITAKNMNWRIIDSNTKEGRIEAVATTFWFGFKDDIVIRVTPEFKGSRVDIRSTSRVGRSDIGTNAERVRTFLKNMMKE